MACLAQITKTHSADSWDTSATEVGDTPQAKRQQAFSECIKNRDGCCPFTLVSKDDCHACHFIPFSKGNSTIASWTTHRLRMMIEAGGPHGHTQRDKIVHINDPRNGLLMIMNLNKTFNSAGTNAAAILVTPNYLFSASDLPEPTNYTAEEFLAINRDVPLPEELQGVSPKGLRARRVANGQRGYTLHRFSKNLPTFGVAKHGLDSLKVYPTPPEEEEEEDDAAKVDEVPSKDADVPTPSDSRPSKLVLDGIYGAVLLAEYGDPAFVQMLLHVPATFPKLREQQPSNDEEIDEDTATGSDGSYEPPGISQEERGGVGLYSLPFIDLKTSQIYLPPPMEMTLPQEEEPKAQRIKEWAVNIPRSERVA
ncbi:hypothetical protein C8J57DRAFT_1291886 [Mycena rebaudengoi]|nr:hypothetical protein C8J57DRAFT_1291886 [Mycena rebaudengoi]